MSAHLHSLAVGITILLFLGGAVALIAAILGPPSDREFDGGEP
jgi:hypothetical protein